MMLSVEETQALILSHGVSMPAESLPLAHLNGRRLCEAVCADADSPPFDSSAMDGYAVCGDAGKRFRLVGEIQAGASGEIKLRPGECARIFTGASVPDGTSRVIMQEEAQVEGADVVFKTTAESPIHIRRRGENCRRGDVVVPAGTLLGPVELAIMASCGKLQASVFRRPRIMHIVTGNELVPPDQTPVGAQIRDCNSTLVAALVEKAQALNWHHCRGTDDPERLEQLLQVAPEFDVLLISGGASVGAYDFARPLLERAGFKIHVQKVNVRPGKPLVFASRGSQLAFALPGNPVSHWVVMQLFVLPMLARLMGGDGNPVVLRGRLAEGHEFRPDSRPTYWPCHAAILKEEYELTPLRFVSSGDIVNMAGANALLVLAPRENKVGRDTEVRFILCP
jgi:molybdopterin molybdotransferase